MEADIVPQFMRGENIAQESSSLQWLTSSESFFVIARSFLPLLLRGILNEVRDDVAISTNYKGGYK